jgi:hypothetical protein
LMAALCMRANRFRADTISSFDCCGFSFGMNASDLICFFDHGWRFDAAIVDACSQSSPNGASL